MGFQHSTYSEVFPPKSIKYLIHHIKYYILLPKVYRIY